MNPALQIFKCAMAPSGGPLDRIRELRAQAKKREQAAAAADQQQQEPSPVQMLLGGMVSGLSEEEQIKKIQERYDEQGRMIIGQAFNAVLDVRRIVYAEEKLAIDLDGKQVIACTVQYVDGDNTLATLIVIGTATGFFHRVEEALKR